MKKFNELRPEDFPGFEPAKIEEWMAAAKAANSNYLKAIGGLFLLFIVVSIAVKTLVLPGVLLIIFIPFFTGRRVRALEKEMGMTRLIVMKARRGELKAPDPANP